MEGAVSRVIWNTSESDPHTDTFAASSYATAKSSQGQPSADFYAANAGSATGGIEAGNCLALALASLAIRPRQFVIGNRVFPLSIG